MTTTSIAKYKQFDRLQLFWKI